MDAVSSTIKQSIGAELVNFEEALRQAYYDPKSSASFGGIDRLIKCTGAPRKVVAKFLQQQDTYTKHKAVRHEFRRRKIVVPCVDYLWQADLVVISKFSRKNEGVKYLLTVIDVLSRYGFARPLRNKTSFTVTAAFSDILLVSKRQPRFLQTDRGTEFGAYFKASLLKNNITMFHNFSPLKAAMVERFNRTLMMRIHKYLTYTKSTVYVNHLQDFIESYNSSVHRIIKCAPKDVDKFNEMDVWMNTYKNLENFRGAKPKYSTGHFVRIKADKKTFEKGFTRTFSDEIYRIREIVNSNPITYLLSNSLNEDIFGVFYNEELSSVLKVPENS